MSHPDAGTGSGAPLTRRQLRELAAAQAEREAAQTPSVQPTRRSLRTAAEAQTGALPAVSATSAQDTASPSAAPLNAAPVQSAVPAPPVPAPPVPVPPVPASGSGAPARPLSRRELRERAEALRAQQAPSAGSAESVPQVAPPAVTGSIRAIDETGRLTPVRPVESATPVVTPSSPATPRVSVRQTLARAVEKSAPSQPSPAPVSPTAPSPARAPRSTDASDPASTGAGLGAGAWAPVTPPAAVVDQPVWPRTSAPSPDGGPVRTSISASLPPARSAPSPDAASAAPAVPAAAAEPEQTSTAAWLGVEPESDEAPPVPAWEAVRPEMSEREPFAPVHPEPESHDGGRRWLGYTPLQYLVLVVVGLVLGLLVWQLLDRAGASTGAEAPAAVITVDAAGADDPHLQDRGDL